MKRPYTARRSRVDVYDAPVRAGVVWAIRDMGYMLMPLELILFIMWKGHHTGDSIL